MYLFIPFISSPLIKLIKLCFSQIRGMSGENKERMLPTSGYENGLIALVKTDREDYHSTLYASFGTMVKLKRCSK